MEKEVTTPDNYPLTVNSLVNACNQSTNRWPVVSYGEGEVTVALSSLREQKFTRIVYSPSNRAAKHRHVLAEALRLEPEDQAVLCVLALRGPQTVGEIKGRGERMFAFADLAAVETTLDALASREEPLVARLDRQPGQKDVRYAHLLSGEVVDHQAATEGTAGSRRDRIDELITRVESLEAEVASLRGIAEKLQVLLD